VVVLDNCSTDRTPEIVQNFTGLNCEFIRNEKNLGLFGNLNRSLDFSTETEYLQILHADDTIGPEFYEVMMRELADCAGRGMAWSVDERIDENNRHLSFSGPADGKIEVLAKDVFLQRKAELGNQSFCAVLLKTGGQPAGSARIFRFLVTRFSGRPTARNVRKLSTSTARWRNTAGTAATRRCSLHPASSRSSSTSGARWKQTNCCAAAAGAGTGNSS
jgi:glycosyltransferase involved in cell wall biosynthesis